MEIDVGTERISREQMSNLRGALHGGLSDSYTVNALRALISDEEILSGMEQVHPDWIGVYEGIRGRLRAGVNEVLARRVDEFFAAVQPFDPLISSVDPATQKVSFLLGAGASKPEPSDIPTVKELLPDLLTRARRLDRDEVSLLANFCDEANIDNIEDLLTAAQISGFCSRNPAVFSLVEFLIFREGLMTEPSASRRSRRTVSIDVSSVAFLQDTLQVLFGLLSSRMLPADPNPGHNAVVEFVKENADTPIVTTNYDCCIDRALDAHSVSYSYMLEFCNTTGKEVGDDVKTSLLKLHGSLNWFYCETCQEVHLIDIERAVEDFKHDRASYPVIGVCPNCGGQRRGLLVPPQAMKFDVAPPLNPLIDRAALSFAGSDLVVVVGFSFAEADLYISRMLSKAMHASRVSQLIIFDPDFSVVEKVRRKFSIRIPDFDSSRILWVRGDCSETLPKFLSGRLYKPDQPEGKSE